MSNILSIDTVSKYYGQLKALDGISFEVPENSIFAILGPNGSGKSTLIRVLAGLITSWEGNIFYKNHEHWSESGCHGSVWCHIETESIPRGLGSLWDASRPPNPHKNKTIQVSGFMGGPPINFPLFYLFPTPGNRARCGVAEGILHYLEQLRRTTNITLRSITSWT